MTYTIKDNNGNTICSIENIDPVRSTEMSDLGQTAIILGTFLSLFLGTIGIFSIKDKIKANKIIKILGKEKIELARKYEQKCIKFRSDFYNFAKSKEDIFKKQVSLIDKNVFDVNCFKYDKNINSIKNKNIDEFDVGITIDLRTKNTDFTYNKLDKIFNEFIKELSKFKSPFKLKRVYTEKENGDGDEGDFSWWKSIIFVFKHDTNIINEIINPIKKYLR